jgi:hypothetical protein
MGGSGSDATKLEKAAAQGKSRFRARSLQSATPRGILQEMPPLRLTAVRAGFIVCTGKEATMTFWRIAGLIFVVLVAGLASPANASPLERLVTRYHGHIPACDSDWALGTIAWRFGYREWRYWGSPERLTHFGDVREIAYRPWGPEYQPRRYCQVKVRVSEHHETVVYYSIIENGGFAGVGWGVEWCVVGYDYNLAYAPKCRAARP